MGYNCGKLKVAHKALTIVLRRHTATTSHDGNKRCLDVQCVCTSLHYTLPALNKTQYIQQLLLNKRITLRSANVGASTAQRVVATGQAYLGRGVTLKMASRCRSSLPLLSCSHVQTDANHGSHYHFPLLDVHSLTQTNSGRPPYHNRVSAHLLALAAFFLCCDFFSFVVQ